MSSTDFAAASDRGGNYQDVTISTGPWTVITWAKWDTVGGTGEEGGHIFGNSSMKFYVNSGGVTTLGAKQLSNATNGLTSTTGLFATGTWFCLACTFDTADNTLHIYYGTERDRMQEATYSSAPTAMTGTRTTSETDFHFFGNNRSAFLNSGFDGRLWQSAMLTRLMPLDEMERFRQGEHTVLFARGNPFAYITMTTIANPLVGTAYSRRGVYEYVIGTASSDEPTVTKREWDWRGGTRHRSGSLT